MEKGFVMLVEWQSLWRKRGSRWKRKVRVDIHHFFPRTLLSEGDENRQRDWKVTKNSNLTSSTLSVCETEAKVKVIGATRGLNPGPLACDASGLEP